MQAVLDSYRIQQTQATMLVVIDSAVSAPKTLAQGVQKGATPLLLNPEVDAIAQITEALAQGNYTSLHLVSHGSAGSLHLGKTNLTVANLSQYRQQLMEWGVAEILIYGCEVAKEATLLQQLYNLTGANIAASEYKVGKGNWDLSWQIGEITSESAFTEELKQEYQGEFAGFEDQVTYTVGDNPQSIAIGDLDTDGDNDLVVANLGNINPPSQNPADLSTTVSVLRGDDSGSFGSQSTFETGGWSPAGVAVGDLDGDGSADDVAVANMRSSSVSLLLGNGSGGLLSGNILNTGAGSFPISVAIGDFDGDGDQDDPTVVNFLSDTRNFPRSVVAGDFDGDGTANDLAVANFGNGTVSVILDDGTETTYNVGSRPSSVAIGNFNGDTNPDLVVANRGDGTVSVLLGNGSGGFGSPQAFTVGDNPIAVAVGDVNNDGFADIVATNYGDDSTAGNTISVLEGNGSGGFAAQQTFTVGNRPSSLAIGDLDGDNQKDDIAVANSGDNTVSVLLECFLTGTHILTDKGEIAVEDLQIGDNVVTAEGKLEPVKWIGYQTVAPNQVKQPLRGYPVLIKAGALGNNLPQQDLSVSPDHAMYFEGILINAGALVNGTSIVKTEPTEAFTYYHVELENHALLLAEGASAESYLPQNEDRLAYENGAEYEELYPHGSKLMLWPMDYPRVSSWSKVPRYMRKKLNAIAEELGLVVKAA